MKLKNYELQEIIDCIRQCDGEFGLATRNKEAFEDLKNNENNLREYNGRIFLNAENLINKLKLINKPVETTNEQSNLELEPEYFKDLNSILGSYYEMFEDDETKENELALVEVLQDRIDFLED